MRTFQLNKLVRNKIVQFTLDWGGSVRFKKLENDDLNEALVDKLIEEAGELKKSGLSVDEIADLQEIIDQLCRGSTRGSPANG